jgi:Cu/Ag efflux pump CusA
MTGIIINDSIVLVTTIDEYAHERGVFPAIIDGAADRLRPVMLTTLTTVLGLCPLLYEQSQQAQFLKPTVITLTYGLGFGMLLVLLVVPSLIAAQTDVARMMQALQRVWRGRFNPKLRPLVKTMAVTSAAMAAGFVVSVLSLGLTFVGVMVYILYCLVICVVVFVFCGWPTSKKQRRRS